MVKQVRQDPTKHPGTSILQAWMLSPRTLYEAPLAWEGLRTGVYDFRERSNDGSKIHYKLAVRRDPDLIGFIRYDVGRDELTTKELTLIVGASIVFFSLLSIVLGYWSSARVISPVLELAQRLRGLERSQSREKLATHFAADEVGQLAKALDHYGSKLRELTDRDREFNADVSHELRTPLTVILSATELMSIAPNQSVKQIERLMRVRRAAQQCSQLIETLLLLSRSERALPADGENIRVAAVVEEVVENCRVLLAKKDVTLEIVETSNAIVSAPSSVLAVTLGNLIGNACKYTPKGKVEIFVTNQAVIIRDTGPGFTQPPEKLFERGVRGSEIEKGAGLGLAIVRRICDLYRWDIKLGSRQSGGAEVTLTFHK